MHKARVQTLFIAILIFSLTRAAYAESLIDRIEPPFWWTGMAEQTVQLMVYGKSIGKATVTSSNPSIIVQNVHTTDNPNYIFVDLTTELEQGEANTALRFELDDGAQQTVRYTFNARAAGSAERAGFSSKDVVYLLTPDRFANGNPNNDAVAGLTEQPNRSHPGGRHGGDLQGITQNLAYLANLGITQLWLNPIQENNEATYSYHGYAISDLYQVDARLGGNQALLSMTARARELGIGVIMDSIPNHIGAEHWWMRDLPSKDWIHNEGKFTQTSHRHEMIQDPYAPESERREFNDGWFVPSMPDLNQSNPLLANYIVQNTIWWIEYAGLSGLRVDTLPYADKHFTRDYNQRILAEYPNLNIVGEEWSTNPAVVAYWQRGKLNQDGFDAGSPSLMDFPLQEALIQALTEPEADRKGLMRLHVMLANDFQYPDADNLVVLSDNHDMNRVHTWLKQDVALTKMALGFLFTIRGIPQLFYGTEILMDNTGTDDHGVIRSDYPGGWVGDTVNAFTGQGLTQAQLDMQNTVRELLNWRKHSVAIHSGELVHYVPKDGVYVYFRVHKDDVVMVLMNKNEQTKQINTARFKETLGAHTRWQDVLTQATGELATGISVPAKTTMIVELKQ
ncbi:glycosyl hydrolase [Arenicella chitinivorans]|uniref:Glycosyl hydrolase n=1 Tax=Arenicella chitinivorans TaxID=1329800 RepID=A0A918RPC7_9GAMM|nr:glycoside hydrolase family 13 protein [Arenicella chitinivorans]GHA05027.1 glycosyl hydrolase [Arenicella chitinivorans]